jgi:hypothetical protein
VYQIIATSQFYVNLKDTCTEICDWTENNSMLQLPVDLSNWKDAYSDHHHDGPSHKYFSQIRQHMQKIQILKS